MRNLVPTNCNFVHFLFRIKSDRFVQLSNEISEIFNEQSKIYYIPHSNVGGKINQAAGKLWNAFNNIKKSMRSNDMLLPKIKNTNESEPMEINVACKPTFLNDIIIN